VTIKLLNCDVMDGLSQLENESVHCIVTSPPYWGLRDYGVEGQIGLEPTAEGYVAKMVQVFREVRRVLRGDGTCWVNLGDGYHGGGYANHAVNGQEWLEKHGGDRRRSRQQDRIRNNSNLKPKDLIGMPWRVAFALQADGWWLRSDIIWSKPNPMPESVTDRPTKAHEYLFLLTKKERYYYDAEAIREAGSQNSHGSPNINAGRKQSALGQQKGGRLGKWTEADRETGRNKRSVWTISTAPYAEAHFATFPPELPELCIKAGCPKGGTVLDPFGGAGTTGLVADRLQRNAILIELNPEYAAMSEARVDKDRGGLLDMMESEASN